MGYVSLPSKGNKVTGRTLLWLVFAIIALKACLMSLSHPVMVWSDKMSQVVAIENTAVSDIKLKALAQSYHFTDYRHARASLMKFIEDNGQSNVYLSLPVLSEGYALASDYVQYYRQGELHFQDWFVRMAKVQGYNEDNFAREAVYQQQKGLFKGLTHSYDMHTLGEIRSWRYIGLSFLFTTVAVIMVSVLVVIVLRPFVGGRWGQVGRLVLTMLPVSISIATLFPYLMAQHLSLYQALNVLSPHSAVFVIMLFIATLAMVAGRLHFVCKKAQKFEGGISHPV